MERLADSYLELFACRYRNRWSDGPASMWVSGCDCSDLISCHDMRSQRHWLHNCSHDSYNYLPFQQMLFFCANLITVKWRERRPPATAKPRNQLISFIWGNLFAFGIRSVEMYWSGILWSQCISTLHKKVIDKHFVLWVNIVSWRLHVVIKWTSLSLYDLKNVSHVVGKITHALDYRLYVTWRCDEWWE